MDQAADEPGDPIRVNGGLEAPMPHTHHRVEGLRAIQNPFAAYTMATKTPTRRRTLRGADGES